MHQVPQRLVYTKAMAKDLVCWRCAGSLKSVARPISRLARCPSCGVDLHACRLCRHYNPRLIGRCAHDHADPPLDREHANFCQYFRPVTLTTEGREYRAAQRAKADLEALFGSANGREGTAKGVPDTRSDAERAREELEKLFGGGSKDERN